MSLAGNVRVEAGPTGADVRWWAVASSSCAHELRAHRAAQRSRAGNAFHADHQKYTRRTDDDVTHVCTPMRVGVRLRGRRCLGLA